MKLLLFDIDGTLINTGGAGKRAMTQAFEDVFGVSEGLKNVRLSGMTDSLIFKEACEKNNTNHSEETHLQFKENYLKHLKREIKVPNPNKYICPGIEPLLETLSKRNDIALGLLTGNYVKGAEVKLGEFDLFKYFSFGAFGDDSADRNKLIPFAIERFSTLTGKTVSGANVWIIGDTPKDIDCARPHGAFAYAVATGTYSVQDLEKSQPDVLEEDLSDIKSFLAVLDKKLRTEEWEQI